MNNYHTIKKFKQLALDQGCELWWNEQERSWVVSRSDGRGYSSKYLSSLTLHTLTESRFIAVVEQAASTEST
jgi:hypothetical protein